MIFKDVRTAALNKWLAGTKRHRANESDDISQAYECSWQNLFGTKAENSVDHYSVFCSIGEWNTNLTDYLTDERFDHFDLTDEHAKEVLFRHYTRILLCASEILTDFQDTLSTFNAGHYLTGPQLSQAKGASRTALSANYAPAHVQNLFTYINNVCKHKVNNIHVCNHHLKLHFEETGACPSANCITVNDVDDYISKNPDDAPNKTADTIAVPALTGIIDTLINCYIILDAAFRNDNAAYLAFCDLYLGTTVGA